MESKCSLNNEISPKTCQYIEDWVFVEIKLVNQNEINRCKKRSLQKTCS
uniref:Uncharacterized protein n=1 Tax=uncultured marine thaumarchaeote AD1000_33_B07 TaxID=1455908 RepID=A0A075FPI0_9ARCH|nr:hypothetical protein [uncultured marine thaumarchaeote AD1000_33_B07]